MAASAQKTANVSVAVRIRPAADPAGAAVRFNTKDKVSAECILKGNYDRFLTLVTAVPRMLTGTHIDSRAPTLQLLDVHLKRKPEHGVVNNQQENFSFAVNDVLPPEVTQAECFDRCCRDVCDSALDGISSAVFAYGQTGAGKTYTMSGPGTSYRDRGMVPRAISHVFAVAESARVQTGSDRFVLRVSYLEIYNDKLIDLLAKAPDLSNVGGDGDATLASLNTTAVSARAGAGASAAAAATSTGGGGPSLQVHEDRRGRPYVPGLTMPLVRSESEAINWLFAGEANRMLAEHALNKASTRSHCIFTIYIDQEMSADAALGIGHGGRMKTQKAAAPTGADGGTGGDGIADSAAAAAAPAKEEQRMVTVSSKLHLVDLAGSERVEKTSSEGLVRREAQAINKSLSFLEMTVMALLDKDRDHVPYRSCKLTHLLKDALGGHCRTRMIAAIWPDAAHLEETVSTLRFATRMMRVRTTPTREIAGAGGMSEVERERLVSMYERELSLLRTELALHDAMAGRSGVRYGPIQPLEQEALTAIVQQFVAGQVDDIEVSTVRQLHAALHILRDLARAGPSAASAAAAAAAAATSSASGRSSSGDSEAAQASGDARHSSASGTSGVASYSGPALSAADPVARSKALDAWSGAEGAGQALTAEYSEARKRAKEKRTQYNALVAGVNEAKRKIDEVAAQLKEVSARSEGDAAGGPGSPLHAGLLTQLTAAKTTYRARFEEVNEIKVEVEYLVKHADQMASKVAEAFQQHWLALCAASAAAAPPPPPAAASAAATSNTSSIEAASSAGGSGFAATRSLGVASPSAAPSTAALSGGVAAETAYEVAQSRAKAIQAAALASTKGRSSLPGGTLRRTGAY